MTIGPLRHQDCTLSLNGNDIEQVNHFKYLGRIISNDGDDSREIESRISAGWNAFQSKKNILTHKRLTMKTKRRTYETYILPSVLYGIESITFSPASLEKLDIFENKIMR